MNKPFAKNNNSQQELQRFRNAANRLVSLVYMAKLDFSLTDHLWDHVGRQETTISMIIT